MWALTPNIISSIEPGVGRGAVKCSCGWSGKSQRYGTPKAPPSGLTELIVRDDKGNELASSGRLPGQSGLIGYVLAPGERAALYCSAYCGVASAAPTPWESIEGWGFHISKAGMFKQTGFSQNPNL
jgi:hypothetical protein